MRSKIVREVDPLNPEGTRLRPLTAGAFPVKPPREWFEDPKLTEPTPLTVTADGRVYGHIAAWDSRHIGLPGDTRPPRSRSNYAYFHTGVVACADGSDVPVGQLTIGGGHAALSADAASAVAHYDNTCSAVIDMHVGEDRVGIWAAGAVRPGVRDEDIRVIRASAPSGDWRPINGGLELVGVLQVNVPGFPTARARVAGGAPLALVAAGAADMMMRRYRNADREHTERVAELEAQVASLVSVNKETLRSRVHATVAGGNPFAGVKKGENPFAKGKKKGDAKGNDAENEDEEETEEETEGTPGKPKKGVNPFPPGKKKGDAKKAS